MSRNTPELDQLRNDLAELASKSPPLPMPDANALYAQWRNRRRRARMVTACAAVSIVAIAVPLATQLPWGQDEPAVTTDSSDMSDELESRNSVPSPVPTEPRKPDLETFDYEGACPDDARQAGSCPIDARGQREWQRLVEAFGGPVTLKPIALNCEDDGETFGCGFHAYVGDVPFVPEVVPPNEELVATWPQLAFFLEVPSGNGQSVTPEVLCETDGGRVVPFDKCDPNQNARFKAVREDAATANGMFWRIPRESSLGEEIVSALENWSRTYR